MSTLLAKNTTLSSQQVNGEVVYNVNSSNTDIIKVRNQFGKLFNAFRFSYSGSFWFFVVDGIQQEWVDNLLKIGYYIGENCSTGILTETSDTYSCDIYPNFSISVNTIGNIYSLNGGEPIGGNISVNTIGNNLSLSGIIPSSGVIEVVPVTTFRFFTNATNSKEETVRIDSSHSARLYDNGSTIPFNPGYYPISGWYFEPTGSRQYLKLEDEYFNTLTLDCRDGFLYVISSSSGSMYLTELEIHILPYSTSYLSPYKVSTYVNYQRNMDLYDENGNTIPYDVTKNYVISGMRDGNTWSIRYSMSLVNNNGNLAYYSNNTGYLTEIFYFVFDKE